MNDVLVLDGSHGEGGGQILRTSLALSMLTQTPIAIEKIRANRSKPGLMRQHLTAVRAAASVCGAQMEGDALGSTRLSFHPGEIVPRDYTFRIGTAGSTGLVLQTVLPALMCAKIPTRVTIEGGTHNPKAPSVDYIAEVFAPQLATIGPRLTVSCDQHGFYPAGGGRVVVEISPVPREELRRFTLMERGEDLGREGVALLSNLPHHIGRREMDHLRHKMGWGEEAVAVREVDSPGPGNVVFAKVCFAHVCEMFTTCGEKGKPGERVVEEVVGELRAYLASGAPVGEYLADQLLLPMALGKGGEFICSPPSMHTRTQAEIIEKFLEVEITFERVDGKTWRASVEV